MNWFKHIFIKNKDHPTDELKKKLFDNLSIYAKNEANFALNELKSSETGLSSEETKKRIKIYGVNSIADDKKTNHFLKLLNILKSPINILLASLAFISLFIGGDIKAFSVIIVMMLLSVTLYFYQET